MSLKAQNSKLKARYIIGIDEVGRGCLAGMVTVAALAMPQNSKFKNQISKLQFKNKKLALRDSKRLTRLAREEWFEYLRKHPKIFYATASIQPAIIDRVNIAQAANRAATRALHKLITNNQRLTTAKVFLDGGLRLGSIKYKVLSIKTIIRGDEAIPAVALASIAAKVTRDRRMREWHKKYPDYDFIRNVGYGTKAHRRALRLHGPTPLHRLTFIKKYATIGKFEARSTKSETNS